MQARYVTEDVEHHGRRVPPGSIMLLLTASANRDERRIADPDRFDIHRSAGQHIACGYGIHFCLGAALARLEARVALEEVFQRYSELLHHDAHACEVLDAGVGRLGVAVAVCACTDRREIRAGLLEAMRDLDLGVVALSFGQCGCPLSLAATQPSLCVRR